ncbi:hypothetical protein [Nostoc sp.]|uniref:hypothetical protein n=1 Tax=Nostoc sp. TaxID=1180 RepID=UPI002FF8D561
MFINEAEFDYSISENLDCRIQDDLEVYEGHLPERFSLAWKGYVTGLMEWQVIDLTNYKKLLSLLPVIANDPVPDILLSKESLNAGSDHLDTPEAELQARLEKYIDAFSGNMPESYAIAWNSYLGGLFEWGVIKSSLYRQLLSLLPELSNPDPVLLIFIGRKDTYSFQEYIKDDIEAFKGNLPERNAIAWKAYLRGFWEYGAISTKGYQQLLELLPTTIDLEKLNIFSERGQTPKGPGGFGASTQVSAELHSRIQQQLNAFQGDLPEDYLITWDAYLLSLQEWDVIDRSDYTQLVSLLPPISGSDPVKRIANAVYS